MRPAKIACVAALLVACACGGGKAPRAQPAPSARPAGIDLAGVPTATAVVVFADQIAAEGAAIPALQDLAVANTGVSQELLPAQRFSGASAIDTLRLSQGAGVPADEARTLLSASGWAWLVTQQAVDLPPSGYREWRIDVIDFFTAANAGRYLQQPFLLPATLLASPRQVGPDALSAGAVFLRAADTSTTVVDASAPAAGERAAVVWRRGRIVLQVTEVTVPAAIALEPLSVLTYSLNARVGALPGALDP